MLLHLFSALLFGVSSNIDNLVVGLSYGIKKTKINWNTNGIVGLISFTGTVLSMLLGKSLLTVLPQGLPNLFGGLVIMLIGAAGFIRFLIGRNSGQTEETAVTVISTREAFLLGFALTVNNAGLGVGASITGLPVLPTALCSFFFSLFFLYAGNRIGSTGLPRRFERLAEPAADLLMVVLGLYEIFI